MANPTSLRTALVHDWLNQVGGAENVLAELVRLFTGAPVFTSMYDPIRMPPAMRAWDIRTTFMQRLPGVTTHHQAYLPLYPYAFSRLDLGSPDLVLSNKSGFCHGVRIPAGAVHVCYCLAPTRFIWQYEAYRSRERIGRGVDVALRPLLTVLRRWDYAAAQRVHHLIAISTEIQGRIKQFYHRDSNVVFPPVDTERFVPGNSGPGEYFLTGGRLIPYKRIDLAVRACSELGLKLVVYGDGRDRAALEKLAGPTVSFAGRLPEDELLRLLQGARAFIFPGFEDFGIAPVEAQAAGRPVIAYARGGALDTVVPGITGEFFREQSVQSLAQLLAVFDVTHYDADACRANAERYSTACFRERLLVEIESALAAHRG